MTVGVRYGLAALGLMLAAGCQSVRPLYYWGNYEPTLYQAYAKPGKFSPEEQIARLEEDVAKAAGQSLPVPPGLHAHLGYLYAAAGKKDVAVKEFETEKRLFPESARFIDRMLQQLESPLKS